MAQPITEAPLLVAQDERKAGFLLSPIPRAEPVPVEDFLARIHVLRGLVRPGEHAELESGFRPVTPEGKQEILGELASLSELSQASGTPIYLGGGMGIGLALEGDIYRDQTDIDVEIEAGDIDAFFDYTKANGYRCFDPEKRKPVFTKAKLGERIIFAKTEREMPGPSGFDAFVIERDGDIIKYGPLGVVLPSSAYDNLPVYTMENGQEVTLGPVPVKMFYKIIFAIMRNKPQDIADLERYYPLLTPEQHKELYEISQIAFPHAMRSGHHSDTTALLLAS